MSKKLLFTLSASATQDLALLLSFLTEQKEEDVYPVILQYMYSTISLLCEFPEIGKVRIGNRREMIVKKTKYIIYYMVKNNVLKVLRIYHSSQNWK